MKGIFVFFESRKKCSEYSAGFDFKPQTRWREQIGSFSNVKRIGAYIEGVCCVRASPVFVICNNLMAFFPLRSPKRLQPFCQRQWRGANVTCVLFSLHKSPPIRLHSSHSFKRDCQRKRRRLTHTFVFVSFDSTVKHAIHRKSFFRFMFAGLRLFKKIDTRDVPLFCVWFITGKSNGEVIAKI